MKSEYFKDKDVLIMGLGRFGGGADSAKFAAAQGARVTVTDLSGAEALGESIEELGGIGGIEFRLGSHERVDFERADVVVVNPAVAPENEFLEIARQAGVPITSQIAIFFELCPATTIGITGANGKSTTAALTAHLLSNAPSDVRNPGYEGVILSGNIGNRPLLASIDSIAAGDLVVLELSSFQLEQLAERRVAPNVSLLTNLTPNHLDRHGTFAKYCEAKENIFKFQQAGEGRAISIFNAEDEVGARWFEKYRGEGGRTCIEFSADDIPGKMRESYPLPGRMNLSNLAAARAIAKCFGISDEAIVRSLPSFKSLPHRLELVASSNGVRWYNDSIATTPQSAIAALDSFECPSVIIAGGYDKNLSFEELGAKIAQKAKAAILLGQTASKIAEAIEASGIENRGLHIERVDSLGQAVAFAAKIAISGDVVLLSPACASYDMFDNFQQRGEKFRQLAENLPTA